MRPARWRCWRPPWPGYLRLGRRSDTSLVAPQAALAVPIGDSWALAAAIRRLLHEEELRLRIAREALQRAVREDADYTAEEFQRLYSSLPTCRRSA